MGDPRASSEARGFLGGPSFLSLKVDQDLGGVEDLGPVLAVLAVLFIMV